MDKWDMCTAIAQTRTRTARYNNECEQLVVERRGSKSKKQEEQQQQKQQHQQQHEEQRQPVAWAAVFNMKKERFF
jgi:transcriptional regulator GlxA family with amidase domain